MGLIYEDKILRGDAYRFTMLRTLHLDFFRPKKARDIERARGSYYCHHFCNAGALREGLAALRRAFTFPFLLRMNFSRVVVAPWLHTLHYHEKRCHVWGGNGQFDVCIVHLLARL